MSPREEAPPAAARRRSRLTAGILTLLVPVVLLLFAALAVTRYGVLVPQVRLLIEARTDGLKLGRLGRLKVEGISGDIWRDARVRRLTIRDERGIWLEAKNVHVSWRYTQLLRRRFEADRLEADSVRVLRRPTLAPKGKDRGLPLSFHIARGGARVLLEPAFSYRRGLYDVTFSLDVERRGDRSGALKAASRLHAGDQLTLDFAVRPKGPFRLVANAEEARGGALAGALGLPADRPFRLAVSGGGAVSQGRFTAQATSGAVTPLAASGAWTADGGQAGGRLLLSASTLTAPLAKRFGGEVLFGLGGRKSAEGDFALAARLRSDALAARAWGRGDAGKRRLSAQGLRVETEAPSLSRIVGGPASGAARIAGLLTGEAAAWRFAGAGVVADMDFGDYALGRLSGPFEVSRTKGALAFKAKLAGADGRGAGFAAAILGGAPTLAIDGQRLANGQVMVRRLDLAGRGVTAQASGVRSLLGAVTLKGQAQVSNLAAARAGASGGARVEAAASQSRPGAPWNVSFDAQGERFALGVAELDRLLGGAPRLRGEANWRDGRLAVATARLEGAALDATTSGVMEKTGALAFKIDWNATGPFRAGPLEIAGQVKGSGGVTGARDAPRLDLVAEIAQIDAPRLPLRDARVVLTFQRQPDGAAGRVAMTAASAFGPASARSDFRFPAGGVDLTDLSLDAGGVKAEGALALRRGAPSAADLRVNIGRGAFLAAGSITGTARITEAGGGARAVIDLRGEGVRAPGSAITIRTARLAADGPLARLPFTAEARGASGQGAWTFNGRGLLSETRPGYLATFEGRGALGDRDLHTTEAAIFRFAGSERSARVRLAGSDGGRLELDGAFKDNAASVRARVTEMGLNLFDSDFDGWVNATLVAAGRGPRLDGVLDAQLLSARGRGTPAALGINGTLKARLSDSVLDIDLATSNAQGLNANASFVLPAEASAAPFRVAIARQKPMRGRFFAEGEVRPLWELAIGGERALAGFVRTEGTVSGTLAKPQANGRIAVERGRFDDGASGLSLRDVSLTAAFDESALNVTDARGVDGRGGRVSGQGRISLLPDGVSSFRLDLRSFRLIDNETATAVATGQATINRAADGKVKLSGDLAIDRADIAADPPVPSGVVAMDVRELNRPDDLPVAFAGARKRGEGWALDVNLRAARGVFLRGRGLDVEFSLDAHVGGTTANADLTGTARVVRGDYDFAGKRFEIDETSIVYLSAKPQNIRLQLDAVREDSSLKVTVRIRGTAARPEVTLASSPSLPNDEVLAKVLFERSASQLSPVEAAQLASALSSLAGGGGLDVIGNLRSFAGLDRLAFGGDDQSGVTVSGGKFINDDVYLEITGGGREGPSAQVEWRVRKNLSILSRLTGQGGNRLAVRWRRDY